MVKGNGYSSSMSQYIRCSLASLCCGVSAAIPSAVAWPLSVRHGVSALSQQHAYFSYACVSSAVASWAGLSVVVFCWETARALSCSMPCSITYVLHLNGQSQFSSTSYFLPGCSLLVSPVRLVVNHNARALRSSFWGAPINTHICLAHQILPGKTQIFYS